MRSLGTSRLAPLSLVAVLTWLPPARAAEGDPDPVKFETADKVELQGKFYPTKAGKKAPCVILLHRLGGSSSEEGWDGLAKKLSEKGFAVLTFDFRGHGNSTSLKDKEKFWKVPANQQMATKSFNPTKLKDTINFKDFNASYYPTLINDLCAAKNFLELKKHDSGECNTYSIALVGAEDGATLGALWMMTEMYRHKVAGGRPEKDPEGKDLACAVWLSMSPSLGSKTVSIHDCLKVVGKEKKVPMAFLYGEDDSKAADFAKKAINDVKYDKAGKYTTTRGYSKTKLAGNKLLNDTLDTQQDVVKYLENYFEDNKLADWEKREAKQTQYVWTRGGPPVMAKPPNDDTLHLVPLAQLGVR